MYQIQSELRILRGNSMSHFFYEIQQELNTWPVFGHLADILELKNPVLVNNKHRCHVLFSGYPIPEIREDLQLPGK